mgnify:CR=1 FL=1|tara:strand:- start:5644 stop:6612 length:969 start_codon:yes stop_codon:yes gene_type:complete
MYAIGQKDITGSGFVAKFGEVPDLDIADGVVPVWDAMGAYTKPTQGRIHDLVSDDVADKATLVTSGTFTTISQNVLTDTTKDFIALGVTAGDSIVDDTNIGVATIASVTTTTITVQSSMFNPNNGEERRSSIGASYRIARSTGTSPVFTHVSGLSSFFLEQEEFVLLDNSVDGSAVATTGSYARIFHMRVYGSNTTGLAGTLTATAQTDGTLTAQIIGGNNQTMMAIYTIPIDKKGWITGWHCHLSRRGNTVSNVTLRGGTLGGITYPIDKVALSYAGSSTYDKPFRYGFFFPGGTDIYVTADTDRDASGIYAAFDIHLIKK